MSLLLYVCTAWSQPTEGLNLMISEVVLFLQLQCFCDSMVTLETMRWWQKRYSADAALLPPELRWKCCVMVTRIVTCAESKYLPISWKVSLWIKVSLHITCSKSSAAGRSDWILPLAAAVGFRCIYTGVMGSWKEANTGRHWGFHVETVVLARVSYFMSFNAFILISCHGEVFKGCMSEMRIEECQSCMDSVDGDSVLWPKSGMERQGQVSSCICRYIRKSLLPL